jgi:hypothetical protein
MKSDDNTDGIAGLEDVIRTADGEENAAWATLT